MEFNDLLGVRRGREGGGGKGGSGTGSENKEGERERRAGSHVSEL